MADFRQRSSSIILNQQKLTFELTWFFLNLSSKQNNMKAFNEFYISSKKIFWMVNFSSIIAVVLLIGFIFKFELSEILIQLGIGIAMTFVLVWVLGGYNQIKENYLDRQSKKGF